MPSIEPESVDKESREVRTAHDRDRANHRTTKYQVVTYESYSVHSTHSLTDTTL